MAIDPSIIVAVVAAIASIASAWMTHRQSGPLRETHKQVTVNHHSSAKPTVLDRIDDVRTEVLRVAADMNDLHGKFNDHLAHSNRMDARLLKTEGEVAAHLRP